MFSSTGEMFHKGRPVKLAMYPAFSYILYPAKNPASVFGKLEDLKKRLGECTVSAGVAKSELFWLESEPNFYQLPTPTRIRISINRIRIRQTKTNSNKS